MHSEEYKSCGVADMALIKFKKELCKYINYAVTVTNNKVQYVNIKIELVLASFSF